MSSACFVHMLLHMARVTWCAWFKCAVYCY